MNEIKISGQMISARYKIPLKSAGAGIVHTAVMVAP